VCSSEASFCFCLGFLGTILLHFSLSVLAGRKYYDEEATIASGTRSGQGAFRVLSTQSAEIHTINIDKMKVKCKDNPTVYTLCQKDSEKKWNRI